jgi:prepilin-type N-terminal cleavage/methylation domain-containing protein
VKKFDLIKRNQRRCGFTLIELVMVLVILTALAAAVVPIVDAIRRTSDKASASFVMKQLTENIGLYRTLNGKYPGGFDLLIEGDGTANATDGTDTLMGLSSKITGKSVVVDLSTGNALDKTDDLIPNVMQHAVGYRNFPGNSGVNRIAVGTQTHFRVVVDDDILESIYPGVSTNTADSTVYPNKATDYAATGTINIGEALTGSALTHRTAQIMLLGVGPANDSVGKTMVASPAYAAMNGIEDYNRFLAMFAVYDGFTGDKRPQLVGALDSTMDFLNQEVIETFENVIE